MENKMKYNYGSKYILSSKDIIYMFNIINSDLEEKEKAIMLYNFCNYITICNSYIFYKNLELTESKNIKKIKNLYEQYNIKGYFTPQNCIYTCSLKEIELRVEKINIAFNTINSKLSDYKKAERLYNLYPNSSELYKQYFLLIKYGKDDIRLNGASVALSNFDKILSIYKEYEENGIMDNIKYINNNKNYIENYPYAKFIIENYIKSKESFKESEFLNKYGIDMDIFEYCIKTIEELDSDLYNSFIKKQQRNYQMKYINNYIVIKDLANGIKTKMLKDGTIFNIMEFIKRIPFKYSSSFLFNLKEYMKRNNSSEYNIIIDYINDNDLNSPIALDILDYETIYKNKVIINGIEINNKVNDIIIEYMKQNNIPLVNKAYYLVRDMYVRGNIIDKEVKETTRYKNGEKSLILIP